MSLLVTLGVITWEPPSSISSRSKTQCALGRSRFVGGVDFSTNVCPSTLCQTNMEPEKGALALSSLKCFLSGSRLVWGSAFLASIAEAATKIMRYSLPFLYQPVNLLGVKLLRLQSGCLPKFMKVRVPVLSIYYGSDQNAGPYINFPCVRSSYLGRLPSPCEGFEF